MIGHEFWKNFVSDYQWSATLQQTIAQDNSPKKQVLLEKKLMDIFSKDGNTKVFPKVNKLAINTFINKFNETYKTTLTESQRTLINKYILSPGDDGLEFRACLYEEIDEVKGSLINAHSKVKNKNLIKKIDMVVEKLDSYKNNKINENVLSEILRIQVLAEELKS